jgi:hypothetical protein
VILDWSSLPLVAKLHKGNSWYLSNFNQLEIFLPALLRGAKIKGKSEGHTCWRRCGPLAIRLQRRGPSCLPKDSIHPQHGLCCLSSIF